MTLTERLGISRRHLLYVVTERNQIAGYIVRCHTGFDTDQTSRDVRKSCANPAARDLLPQNDRAILIEANYMQRILARIDANRAAQDLSCKSWWALLVL